MSQQGIRIAAKVFERMQIAKGKLIDLGASRAKTKSGQQDILLGRLLDKANDAVKEEFAKLVMMKE